MYEAEAFYGNRKGGKKGKGKRVLGKGGVREGMGSGGGWKEKDWRECVRVSVG